MILDDQSAAKEAVTATNRLLQQEKAVAVIGASTSASTLAMKPITNKAGIPQIAMAAANSITDEAPIDWMWRVAPKDNLAVARALAYVSKELKLTKIAVLYDENAFGSSGMAEIERTKGEYGLEIVAKESYKTDEADLTAHLTKIKGADPRGGGGLGHQPRSRGGGEEHEATGHDHTVRGEPRNRQCQVHRACGRRCRRSGLPQQQGPAAGIRHRSRQQKDVVTKFMADYTAKYGSAPNSFAAHAYDGLTVVLEAIKAAKSTDPTALQTQLNKLTKLSSAGGIFTYTATDHDGLSVDDMIMVKIDGGKWTLAK